MDRARMARKSDSATDNLPPPPTNQNPTPVNNTPATDQKNQNQTNNHEGIYPPENFTELTCDDCLGTNLINGTPNRIHPSDEYLRGPPNFVNPTPKRPEDSSYFNPRGLTKDDLFDARYRMMQEIEYADLPYKVFYDGLKPMVSKLFSATRYEDEDEDEDEEDVPWPHGGGPKKVEEDPEKRWAKWDDKEPRLIHGCMFRGLPNFTSRGGGYRRYQFGRGTAEYYTDPGREELPKGSHKQIVVFNKIRDPVYLHTDKKETGHFPSSGGTQIKKPPRPPLRLFDDEE